jgi:hypothetical protein
VTYKRVTKGIKDKEGIEKSLRIKDKEDGNIE